MRSISMMAGLALASVLCHATTIKDVFNQSQVGCQNSFNPPYSDCDVIGNPAEFDIDKADVTITQGWIDVVLYFNYGTGGGLQPFMSAGMTLMPADVFFYDPANPSVERYGIPLTNHGGYTAGNLYNIAVAPLTAWDVLQSTDSYYRRNQDVWMAPTNDPGQLLASAGSGVQVVDRGLSSTQGQYKVTLHIPRPNDTFWNAVYSSGQVGFVFENATCANDVLAGVVGTPEPSAMVLFGLGIGILGGVGMWRKKRAK